MKVTIEKLSSGFLVEVFGDEKDMYGSPLRRETHAFGSLQRAFRFAKRTIEGAGPVTLRWDASYDAVSDSGWKKIQAIKEVRGEYGLGLREAKERVETGGETFPNPEAAAVFEDILRRSGVVNLRREV